MNILVITLGNSDIQISKNPENGFTIVEGKNTVLIKPGLPEIALRTNRGQKFFLLASSREGGEAIFTNFDAFHDILKFPIITPLLEFLEKEEVKFQEVWWVYTDQQDLKFRLNDTLYFKAIIQKYFALLYSNLIYHEYSITENVKDIDAQYLKFKVNAVSLSNRKSEIEKIILFPQGGIDQINQALTLQLLQTFKDKVDIYQNAEESVPRKLEFSKLFLNDLTKQNVIKHLQDYDFDKASDLILDNNELKMRANYAASRLNLTYEFEMALNAPDDVASSWSKLSSLEQDIIKLQDLVYAFKIQMRQKRFSDSLIKLFTISENLYKLKIEEYCSKSISKCFNNRLQISDKNDVWEQYITGYLNPHYLPALIKEKKQVNNPNAMSLFYLYRWLIRDKKIESAIDDTQIKRINTVIMDLRDRRNMVAHSLGSITELEINDILHKRGVTLQEIYDFIDAIAGTSGFGIYYQIRREILIHYGQIE